jgi:hypothetical protein
MDAFKKEYGVGIFSDTKAGKHFTNGWCAAMKKMKGCAPCPGCGEIVVVELCPSCKAKRGHQ